MPTKPQTNQAPSKRFHVAVMLMERMYKKPRPYQSYTVYAPNLDKALAKVKERYRKRSQYRLFGVNMKSKDEIVVTLGPDQNSGRR